MDKHDCELYARVYRLLADILTRERPADEQHLSFILGDSARRVFVGTEFTAPDDILEETSHVIRAGDHASRQEAARRLREHAAHLRGIGRPPTPRRGMTSARHSPTQSLPSFFV